MNKNRLEIINSLYKEIFNKLENQFLEPPKFLKRFEDEESIITIGNFIAKKFGENVNGLLTNSYSGKFKEEDVILSNLYLYGKDFKEGIYGLILSKKQERCSDEKDCYMKLEIKENNYFYVRGPCDRLKISLAYIYPDYFLVTKTERKEDMRFEIEEILNFGECEFIGKFFRQCYFDKCLIELENDKDFSKEDIGFIKTFLYIILENQNFI